MTKYTVITTKPKYKHINGYQCHSRSRYSLLMHLTYKFNLSEFEVKEAYRTGKIKIT